MQFIIWGLGRNGRVLYEILGENRIKAYMDSDEKYLGANYKGIPVITLDQYKEAYQKYPIIISVAEFASEISELLSNNHIQNFYCYLDELTKIRTLFLEANHNLLAKKYNPKKNMVIIGTGLYALLLYCYFQERNYNCSLYENSIERSMASYFNISIANRKAAITADYLLCAGYLDDSAKHVLIDAKGIIDDYNQIKNWNWLFSHPELAAYKNIHQGKRCFIVGTGPSLLMKDLDKLSERNEYCISVNGIFKGFARTKWRPDYYIISDPAGVAQWREDIIKMEETECFVADVAYFFHKEYPHIHKWHAQVEMGENILPEFTEDFSSVSFCGSTITYDGALQLAVYMGFTEIYLLGIDCCQYQSEEKQHFVENYQDEGFKNAKMFKDRQMLAYQSAKSYAMRNEIKILNATRGGQLEVFERADFDSLF